MRHLLFLVVIFFFLGCRAQTVYNITTPASQITAANRYIKDIDNRYAQVLGTWRWEDGDSYFEITFEKFEEYRYPNSSSIARDAIFAKYTYNENGVVVADIDSIETLPNSKSFLVYENDSVYRFSLLDVVSNRLKKGEFKLEPTPSNHFVPLEASFALYTPEGIKIGFADNPEFALPSVLTLTRVLD